MISIFNGRRLSLRDKERPDVWVQISVEMRDHLHEFNSGRNLNPFAIFMAISLHADANGWAFPSQELLSKETGLKTRRTISDALGWLLTMRIEGHRLIEIWRERKKDGTMGRTLYRVFPDAFSDGMESAPKAEAWLSWRAETDDEPCVIEPRMAEPRMANAPLSRTNGEEEPLVEEEPSLDRSFGSIPLAQAPEKQKEAPKETLTEFYLRKAKEEDAARKRLEQMMAESQSLKGQLQDPEGPRMPSVFESWLASLVGANTLEPGQLARLRIPVPVIGGEAKEQMTPFEVWDHIIYHDQMVEEITAKLAVARSNARGKPINRKTVVGMACNFRPQKGKPANGKHGQPQQAAPSGEFASATGKYADLYVRADTPYVELAA